MTSSAFNLDALLGENEPKPLTYKGEVFPLPGELPAHVLAPFLAEDLGLIELVVQAISDADEADRAAAKEALLTGTTAEETGIGDIVMNVIRKRPALPLDIIAAVKESFQLLLDSEKDGQYEAFLALRPTIPAYTALATNILNEYGVSLTDFFSSDEPAETGGTESKPTSSASTESTPEASGDAPETPAS